MTEVLNQPEPALMEEARWIFQGQHLLLEELGEGLGWDPTERAWDALAPDETGFSGFLKSYTFEILLPHELPLIARAARHAEAHEVRELIRLDRALLNGPIPMPLASASRRVGRSQLRRFRTLKDLRVMQRYRHAVEAGMAEGWHTIVYGLTLHGFSLPLRQGLMAYALRTLQSFTASAGGTIRLPMEFREKVFADLSRDISPAIDGIVEGKSDGSVGSF